MSERRSCGRYVYLADGQAADIDETWEVVERGDERHTRSTRCVPAARSVLAVESIQRNGRWRTCDLQWRHSPDDGSQARATASYRFGEGGIEVRLTPPAGAVKTVRVAACAIFSPLLRIYAGETIHRLCRCGGGRVLVPWIGPPDQAQRLFLPQYSERRVRKVGAARIRVDGRSRRCAEFDYSGGPYVPGARFWVDANGLLLRYRWQQPEGADWDVRLADWRSCERTARDSGRE